MRKQLKKTLKKLLVEILKPDILEEILDNHKINKCLNQVTIGTESKFYPQAFVENSTNDRNKIIIGNNTHIRGEISVYPFSNGIKIGDNCYIGVNSIIRSGDNINIGNNVLISHNVTIIDTDSHEIDAFERSESFISLVKNGHPLTTGNVEKKPIEIEDFAWINYNVAILKGITVGKGAIVAAGSVVTKDVPAWTVVAGNPAKVIKHLKNP